jgi:hypothetical protein
MTENDIIIQIALNKELAESYNVSIARTAQKMVAFWEDRLAYRRGKDATLDDLA